MFVPVFQVAHAAFDINILEILIAVWPVVSIVLRGVLLCVNCWILVFENDSILSLIFKKMAKK